jgi:hypothetical protein
MFRDGMHDCRDADRIPFQLYRFAAINLRMVQMIFKSHH